MMLMVFCRMCAKQIDEKVSFCPYCGKEQSVTVARNPVTLVFVGLGWTFVLWIVFLFLGGFIIGLMNLETADGGQQLAEEFGRTQAIPILLASAALSALLTYLGLLPGSSKH